jgi:hypothetical protein
MLRVRDLGERQGSGPGTRARQRDRPSGRDQILNTSTGDKSPAYFLTSLWDTPAPPPR